MHVLARREVDDDGCDVVGEATVALTKTAHGMPHHDISEERQGGMRARGGPHECRGQPRIIEDHVDAFVREAILQLRQVRPGFARENPHGQLRVVACETLSRVRENHETTSSVSCSYPEDVTG